MHGHDLPWVGGTERQPAFAGVAILEDRHEERFAGEQAFAGAEQRAHEPGVLRRAVAEDRLHRDPVVHEHHAAGLGEGGFVGVELHLDELQVVAVNLVVDFVHCGHGGAMGCGG